MLYLGLVLGFGVGVTIGEALLAALWEETRPLVQAILAFRGRFL